MTILLLIVIYLAFISLGLPDSVFGVAWPVIREDLNLPISYAGAISFVLTVGTITSSLLSGYFISKLKTGKIIIFSVTLTIVGLIGFSIAPSFFLFLVVAFPLGFGAGSIDTALNNYVAINYKSHHMNWLHAFWGVGATLGPVIMAVYLGSNAWRNGFLTLAIIQIGFLIVLTLSYPLWKDNSEKHDEVFPVTHKQSIFKIKGATLAVIIFLAYCALEFTIGIWGSSYLVISKSVTPSNAARIVAMYFGGIMIGRFISGGLSFKFSNKVMIFGGIFIVFIGGFLLLLAQSINVITVSFVLLGMGLAPIFPSMIHETPKNFGKENSQYIIGYQIAFAYLGTAIFPPLLGILAQVISINIFPLYVFILALILLLFVNTLYIRVRTKK